MEFPSDVVILDFMFSYIFLMKVRHLPLILVSNSLFHRLTRQTLIKACLKSIKAQESLFLFSLNIFISIN